jgi:hypothetical protein
MHKHGVKAYYLGSGSGAFPYATVAEAVTAGYKGINIVDPPLRDDFVTVSISATGTSRGLCSPVSLDVARRSYWQGMDCDAFPHY